MNQASTYGRRKVRELLAALLHIAETRPARRLLVTSVGTGEGKTTLCKALHSVVPSLEDTSVAFVSRQFLSRVTPDELEDKQLVLIDGPSALEDDGLAEIPLAWRRAIDGVVLVVVKRDTTRHAIEEARTWLAANGMPIVAVVWNEHLLPPLAVQLARLGEYLRRPFTRKTRPRLTTAEDEL